MGRMARPEEIANVVAFLASPAETRKRSAWVTNDKTQGEHNASASGRIATKALAVGVPLSLTAEP